MMLIGGLVAAIATVAIVGAQAIRGDSGPPTPKPDPPGAAEAPALDAGDAPVAVTPGTVKLSETETQAFRARWSERARSEDPRFVDMTPASTTSITAHGRTQLGGGIWSVTTYRSRDGLFCYGARLPGGQGITCSDRGSLFTDGPLVVLSGRRQALDPKHWNVFWIFGFTQAQIARVEIVSTDCSREYARLDDDGVFLHLVGPGKIYQDIWPYRVVGRDGTGKPIAEKLLPLSPPDTALQAGIEAPRPRGCS